jgi:hypothetical protein
MLNFWYGLQEYGSVSESILSVKLSDFSRRSARRNRNPGGKKKKGGCFYC